MICPQCRNECAPDSAFCPRCGALVQRACPQCACQVPTEFAFCPRCGSAVQAGSAEALQQQSATALLQAAQRLIPKEFAERLRATRGRVASERRMITILFCDVKGSSAIAENMDPEDVMDVMSGAFEFLIAPIYRHEGTLARLMGDAILAFFGAPIAHEDDPERAIRAGLQITAEAAEYAEKLKRERGIQGFGVRVGINTGLVVVGEVGADWRVEYTAMGDAVNLAARMEQAAPPGGVLITHDTYRHVRGVFDVQPREPLAVKGKAQPVQTYLVQRAKPRAWRIGTRGVEGIETRMVGREAELLTLQNAFSDALADREARVVTIVGEAGVGKSRLLDEFDNWAELRPEQFFYFKGRGSSVTLTVPFSLMRDLFAYRFDILESDSAAAALAKFRAGMAGVLEPDEADRVGQLVGFDFQAAGSPAVQALLGSPNFGQVAQAHCLHYVRGLAALDPVLMLLEDLQWADDSSLDLVAYLVAELPNAPLLVIGAGRAGLFERRPNWGEGQEAYTRLDLKPLSKRASRELVGEILQKVPEVPEALRNLVVEVAEGNPYYAEELIKMLIEDGVILREEERWRVELERLARVRVPPTLTGVLQARLDSLPPEEKALLQRAAVVGRRFWDALLAELAGDAPDSAGVAPLLGSLRERELVFRRERSAFAGTDEYTFKHSILRDVTYETVLLKLRRKYHSQVAQWLEGHAGERIGEYLGLIASHYELAGEGLKAADYLRRSGEESLKAAACRDARSAFERALGLLPPPGEPEASRSGETSALRATLLVGLGQALCWLSEGPAARERLQEALALTRALGDRRTEAAALMWLGALGIETGELDQARRHLEDGLAVAQASGDRELVAHTQLRLGSLAWVRGDYDAAMRWEQQSRALLQELGDRLGMARALNLLGIVASDRGELERAAGYLSESLALAREIGDRVAIATALNNLGEIARKRGAYDDARAHYEQFRSICEEAGSRSGVALAALNLGLMCLDQGLLDPAVGYLRSGLREASARQAAPPYVLTALVMFARWHAGMGAAERAAELLGLALAQPACMAEDRMEAEPILAGLRQALPADQLEAALARGATLDLNHVVAELLAT
jgi:class 3 adenylate cyclase/tetratricopeptide (TPR) repeat protein